MALKKFPSFKAFWHIQNRQSYNSFAGFTDENLLYVAEKILADRLIME